MGNRGLAVDHVQIAAPEGSEEAARSYFGDLLGLTEIAKPERLASRGGVWFEIGDHQLHIGVENNFDPAKKAHPAFRAVSAADLDEIAARILDAGFPVRWDEELPEFKRFYTTDPWGNRLEILAPS